MNKEFTGTVVSIDEQENPFAGYEILWENGYMSNTFLCKKEDLPKLGDHVSMFFTSKKKK